MDFFGHQEAARRTTRRLVAYFALAVLGIILAIYFASAALLIGVARHGLIWNPGLLAVVTVAVLVVVALAAATKTAQLRSGGPAVAEMLGGTPVEPGTRDELLRRLVNVVEEMSIASGVPVPRIYVLAEEQGINAFAAGWGTKDAAIAVTRGALEQLDRDQLQGVIAHEFSHVFHGDMRLNIRLIGVLFGIVCIATIGEIMLRSMGRGRSRGNGKNSAAGLALFGLALMVIGWIGVLFANLIKAAVSRQREFLADASAVTYTRNPRGIGLALARIGRLGSHLDSGHAREASHLFFANGVSQWFGGLGATHPPLEQRVERILPGYLKELQRTGDAEDAVRRLAPATAPATGPTTAGARAASGATAGLAASAAPRPRPLVASAAVTGMVGTTGAQFVARSRELMASLPLDVVAAAREPARVQALACALLLQSNDPAQTALLDRADPNLAFEARRLAGSMRGCDHDARLPLLELAMPALRTLDAAQREQLHARLDQLALADGALSTFEFALLHTVRRHLPRAATTVTPRRAIPLSAAMTEVELVLSTLAWAGCGGDADAAALAFGTGLAPLAGLPPIRLRPRAECRFDAIERATTRLEQLSPMGKKLLLGACAEVAAADGHIASNEGELLRAFAESWDCPLPPAWTGHGDDRG